MSRFLTFDERLDWQKRFTKQIRQILGEHLIESAPFDEGSQVNGMWAVRGRDTQILVRIRSHRWLKEDPHAVTFRYNVSSGASSEYHRVISGWGNYYFYGFASEDDSGVAQWVLGDLDIFRLHVHNQLIRDGGQEQIPLRNADGSRFVTYDLDSGAWQCGLPAGFVVARQSTI